MKRLPFRLVIDPAPSGNYLKPFTPIYYLSDMLQVWYGGQFDDGSRLCFTHPSSITYHYTLENPALIEAILCLYGNPGVGGGLTPPTGGVYGN